MEDTGLRRPLRLESQLLECFTSSMQLAGTLQIGVSQSPSVPTFPGSSCPWLSPSSHRAGPYLLPSLGYFFLPAFCGPYIWSHFQVCQGGGAQGLHSWMTGIPIPGVGGPVIFLTPPMPRTQWYPLS